jgi:micrococcal nuclease
MRGPERTHVVPALRGGGLSGPTPGTPHRALLFVTLLAAAVLLAACDETAPQPTAANGDCRVERVTDGDTIRVSCLDESIRFLLVAAPEVAHDGEPAECYGDEARDYLSERLPEGTIVTLEAGVENTDQYGRFLRYVFLGDELINETLVRQGYAVRYRDAEDTTYRDEIADAEREAREEGIGLWAAC